MSADDSWIRGFIDGYRSAQPGVTPSVPARPADYPATIAVEQVDDYFYRLGFDEGRRDAGA